MVCVIKDRHVADLIYFILFYDLHFNTITVCFCRGVLHIKSPFIKYELMSDVAGGLVRVDTIKVTKTQAIRIYIYKLKEITRQCLFDSHFSSSTEII